MDANLIQLLKCQFHFLEYSLLSKTNSEYKVLSAVSNKVSDISKIMIILHYKYRK